MKFKPQLFRGEVRGQLITTVESVTRKAHESCRMRFLQDPSGFRHESSIHRLSSWEIPAASLAFGEESHIFGEIPQEWTVRAPQHGLSA
jgi:hypothetical protein